MSKTDGNRYILIADGGSTKADWCLLGPEESILTQFTAAGFNPALLPDSEINGYFRNIRSMLSEYPVPSEVFYYGAGCASEEICSRVEDAIAATWSCNHAEAHSDMLGACRSLLGGNPGIACILGTGSNSALYNGTDIVANTPPMGFILGDEGSGTALGKRLLGDIFKNLAPLQITLPFFEETGWSKEDVIRRTYREPAPNKFLASFVPFIHKHIGHTYMQRLVRENFRLFIERNLLQYRNHSSCNTLGFTGSIAAIFESLLRKEVETYGFKITNIVQRPMQGLIEYHLNRNRNV